MGLSIDEQKAVDRFRSDVVEPSMKKLVIIDFFAEWCGPCKALTPMLEKVAGEYADKGVTLVKIDVDQEQFIAAQFQVQSIPTVYAMFQGQPVADLTNARSESQLKQTLDQILAQLPIANDEAGSTSPQPDVAQFVAMAEEVLSDGDGERAAGIFRQVVEMTPDNAAAHAGLVRALLKSGEIEQARAALEAAVGNPAVGSDPALEQARSAVDLAGKSVDEGELSELRARAQADGSDHEARYAYAEAAYASGDRDAAADELLGMIADDREWNEGSARAKLVQIFEAIGLEDPWVVATRRRLSKLLFG